LSRIGLGGNGPGSEVEVDASVSSSRIASWDKVGILDLSPSFKKYGRGRLSDARSEGIGGLQEFYKRNFTLKMTTQDEGEYAN
jgi:hypothetical protein